MDATIIAGLIGAAGALVAVLVQHGLAKKAKRDRIAQIQAKRTSNIDSIGADDIYFLSFLLHDSYAQRVPMSSQQLAEHHMKYSPLEVEAKMVRMQEAGYAIRTSKPDEGIGFWQISSKGVAYMIDNSHALPSLLKDERNGTS